MTPPIDPTGETIDGFLAAFLVICSGSIGWAVAGMVAPSPIAEIIGATGLASGVVVGGFFTRWPRSDS